MYTKIILKLFKHRVKIESRKSHFRLYFRNVYIHLSKVKQEVNSMYVSMHVETGIEKKKCCAPASFHDKPKPKQFQTGWNGK